jgi:hypothetical protein
LALSLILVGMTVAFGMNAGSAQITRNESETNMTTTDMTTRTIVTNGTAINMTNASTPIISNTT